MNSIHVEIKNNPTADDALNAVIAWFDAETHNIGTCHDRTELCHYAEWAARKVMGNVDGDYVGLPRLTVQFTK